MGAIRWLELDSNDNINLTAATLIGTYTCDADRAVFATIYAQGLAGGGDYIYYATVTPSGLSEGEALKTTQTLGATTYVLFAQSTPILLRNLDVLKIYIDGLAGDTTTPDTRVNFYEDAALQSITADRPILVGGTGYVTAASVEGDINGDIDGDVHGSVDGVTGDVSGRVLGGGIGVITGTGARVVDASGNNVGTLANQTTLLARIGAFTGTGINTILGFLRALGAKAAGLTPSDLSTGTTYDNTTDSQEAAVDNATGGSTPAQLWAYASRTLTQSAATVASVVAGTSITAVRGDTLTAAITGLGNIAAYVTIDFTVKTDRDDADSAAIIKIRKNLSGLLDGLLYINGAVPTVATGGVIALNDLALGNITITLAAGHTDDLAPMQGLFYDIQMITATTVQTLSSGTFNTAADVTRVIV